MLDRMSISATGHRSTYLPQAAEFVRGHMDALAQGKRSFACYRDERQSNDSTGQIDVTASTTRTLFITQDFPPDRGGIARLYGEICQRIPSLEG